MVCYFSPPPGGLAFTDMLGDSIGVVDPVEPVAVCVHCCSSIDDIDDVFQAFTANSYHEQTGPVLVCSDCVFSCDYCDEYYATGHISPVLDRGRTRYMCHVCIEYLSQCDECGHYFDLDNEGTSIGYDRVCQRCVDSCYSYCNGCVSYVRGSVCGSCDMCDDCGCDSDCIENDPLAVNGSGHLLSYDYKPEPIFFGSGPLFLGFELELETGDARAHRSEIVQKIAGDLSRVYQKHDGSLLDGIEIVTHPMSPDSLSDWWPDFSSTLERLAGLGCNSWNGHRCGFHVHLSRDAFDGVRHLFAFSLFIYRNREQLQRLSGRRDEELRRYCRLDLHNGSGDFDGRLIDKVRRSRGAGSRMVAVNLSNSNTIEVRVFRGSLKAATLRGYLDLVLAVFQYTASVTAKDIHGGALNWHNFREWVGGLDGNYSALVDLDRARRSIVGVS